MALTVSALADQAGLSADTVRYYERVGLPFVASLMQAGMGAGPAMALLVTGAGTSLGAIGGGLLIARWRILAIVVGTLWVGAVLLGLSASALGIG